MASLKIHTHTLVIVCPGTTRENRYHRKWQNCFQNWHRPVPIQHVQAADLARTKVPYAVDVDPVSGLWRPLRFVIG